MKNAQLIDFMKTQLYNEDDLHKLEEYQKQSQKTNETIISRLELLSEVSITLRKIVKVIETKSQLLPALNQPDRGGVDVNSLNALIARIEGKVEKF